MIGANRCELVGASGADAGAIDEDIGDVIAAGRAEGKGWSIAIASSDRSTWRDGAIAARAGGNGEGINSKAGANAVVGMDGGEGVTATGANAGAID